MFHLAWFQGDGISLPPWNRLGAAGAWNGTNGRDWAKPDLWIDLARSMERGCFDFILIEDTSMVEDTLGGSMETSLKYGYFAPKNDPIPYVPLMTAATKHIGVVSTMSAIQYHPFMAARMMTSLDHATGGRAGVNVVTSVTHRVAQNYGYDKHFEHDERYRMAEEWMDVVRKLWDSWPPDAVKLDEENYVYADHTKVHPINFVGKYYRSRGPLNTIPGPQVHPLVTQAGNSEAGRELAAATADVMLAFGGSPERMKAFREDMHARLVRNGRNPDEFKILFLMTPILGATDAEARERHALAVEEAKSQANIDFQLWHLSYVSGGEVDFSKFDLDEPLPDIIGNGEQSSMERWRRRAEGKTLREAITAFDKDFHLIGSCDSVAVQMGELMDYVGGDGFLIYDRLTRKMIVEVADGLGTALRRRGLIRDGYGGGTLRENVLAF